MFSRRKNGFVLANLLIVTIVISIIASAMLISSNSASAAVQKEYDELLNELREFRKELRELKEEIKKLREFGESLLTLFTKPSQSTTESSKESAEASRLISDLRNAKAAGIMWIADNVSITDNDLMPAWMNLNANKTFFKIYFGNEKKAEELLFTVAKGDQFLIGKLEKDKKVIEKAINLAGGVLFDRFGNGLTIDNADSGIYMRVK